MFGLGVLEIGLVVALLVLLFGAKRIPLIARGLGEGIRNFKHSIKDDSDDPDRLEGGSDGNSRLGDGQDS
jgi:sec-independent protein translocase protein TatA